MMWKLLQFIFKFSAIPASRKAQTFINVYDLSILISISLYCIQPIIASESPVDNNKSSGVIFPLTQLYPHYIANPLRPAFSM